TDQVPQRATAAEPGRVGRVTDQHRGAGGRPQHPRLAYRCLHQAVDQRRLARAGGTADHHQQGGVEFGQARQQVIVYLGDQSRPVGPGGYGRWKGQWVGRLTNSGTHGAYRLGEIVKWITPGRHGHKPAGSARPSTSPVVNLTLRWGRPVRRAKVDRDRLNLDLTMSTRVARLSLVHST